MEIVEKKWIELKNRRIKKNEHQNNFGVIVSCGYCELQPLLNMKSRVGWNKGVYGWNFDIFDFGGVGLITGSAHAARILCFQVIFAIAGTNAQAMQLMKNASKYLLNLKKSCKGLQRNLLKASANKNTGKPSDISCLSWQYENLTDAEKTAE